MSAPSSRHNSHSRPSFHVDRIPVERIAQRIERDRRESEQQQRATTAKPPPDPRNDDAPTPTMIRAGIRRTALVPAIITVPCADHDAAVGEFCFRAARGVCAARIIARAALR